jgi:acetoacetyl-CoA synthetase
VTWAVDDPLVWETRDTAARVRGSTDPQRPQVTEGDLLWTPSTEQVAVANLTAFTDWVGKARGLSFADYDALWHWSVEDLESFWQSVWDYFGVESSAPHERALADRAMPGARWFPGARLNYTQHVLRRERADATAIMFASETRPLAAVPWEVLAGHVRILATQLRDLGVRPGDRVAGYMPNLPETVVAMLATTSVGAVWACCSPDFGLRGVVDRLKQVSPRVFFCVDGYRYGGKDYDRRDNVRQVIDSLDSVEHVIHLPQLFPGEAPVPTASEHLWEDLLERPAVSADQFEFEQVPFDHPLWILFTSGTTGLPKPIVHGHGGILLEQLKLQHFHMDIRADDRVFFFTTTGWMMWNFLVSTLLLGACPILYDGNPAYPDVDLLWRVADESGATFFGASPAYVDLMVKAGVVPRERHDLSRLRTIMPAGSPVSPECTAWFYDNVKEDLWVATGSGGTDCCTGFVGGVPTLPVYAGEIQARSLGVAAYAFDSRGEPLVDEVGELVITEPMPSMPVYLWGDTENRRYREVYFDQFPGVWRQSDFFRVNRRGGCFVLGRSDATLNRQGVRIGSAEIYRALVDVPGVVDGLVVSLDLPGGKFFMPLFVTLKDGHTLDTETEQAIRERLRRDYTPRHVPDKIIQVPQMPTTLSGKKMEVPIRKILLGTPVDEAVDRNAMANPDALEPFVSYARNQTDYSTTSQPA